MVMKFKKFEVGFLAWVSFTVSVLFTADVFRNWGTVGVMDTMFNIILAILSVVLAIFWAKEYVRIKKDERTN